MLWGVRLGGIGVSLGLICELGCLNLSTPVSSVLPPPGHPMAHSQTVRGVGCACPTKGETRVLLRWPLPAVWPLGPHLSFSRGGGSLELAGPAGPLHVIGVHAAGPRSPGGP